MPWIDGEFTSNANADGLIRNEQRLSAPLSGKLKKYKIKTITGCQGRSHATHVLITRVNDPTDKLEINVDIKDCVELEREIDPPYRIRREEYEVRLTAIGFDPDERVEGVAGVFYGLFLELDLDTDDGGELMPSTAESGGYYFGVACVRNKATGSLGGGDSSYERSPAQAKEKALFNACAMVKCDPREPDTYEVIHSTALGIDITYHA
jgi:hypothetical protein